MGYGMRTCLVGRDQSKGRAETWASRRMCVCRWKGFVGNYGGQVLESDIPGFELCLFSLAVWLDSHFTL